MRDLVNVLKNSTLEHGSVNIYSSILKEAPNVLAEQKLKNDKFVKSNAEDLSQVFAALEILILTCHEAEEIFSARMFTTTNKEKNKVTELVVRLHSHACQIALEILWLLKGGFADAAQSRWRALHETVVTGVFISNHNTDLAERYYNHHIVQDYKLMLMRNEYAKKWGIEPFPENEVEKFKAPYHQLIELYGKNYGKQYGWAADALSVANPSFAQIEKSVGLDHFRPTYKWASENIHAGVSILFSKLALGPKDDYKLLFGQSNLGIIYPTDYTAMSLMQITCKMLMVDETPDSLLMIKIIKGMRKKVKDCIRVEIEENDKQ